MSPNLVFCFTFAVFAFSSTTAIKNAQNVNSISGICELDSHQIKRRQVSSGRVFAETLYKPTDPILQLNSTNFLDQVFNRRKSPKAHVVEFYASWCGHCQRYAPTYVKFADEVKGWNAVVEVASINCAMYEKICDENDVRGYPTIAYFPLNAKEDGAGRHVIPAHTSPSSLKHELIKVLLIDHEANRYSEWPSFDYLSNSSQASDVLHNLHRDTKYCLIIFERPNGDNYTAIETMLDLLPYSPRVVVRRARNDHPLTHHWRISNFPALAVIAPGNEVPSSLMGFHKDVLGNLLTQLMPDQLNDTISRSFFSTTHSPLVEATTPETLESKRAKYYVSETDILMAVYLFIRNDVKRSSKNITGTNFRSLTRFIDLLRKYFPHGRSAIETLRYFGMPEPAPLARSQRARGLFADLYDFLTSRNDNGIDEPSISADEWIQKVDELEMQYNYPFPNSTTWQHCRGSKEQYRGHTCGLWSLFHALTVNAYLEDGLSPNFDPLMILRALKDYIGTYLACNDCRDHFLQMVTTDLKMEDWVKYRSDVVLYLWRAHNMVNRRLANDTTSDPAFPKYQFPADFLCADCKHTNHYGNEDVPVWSDRNVFRFLINYYSNIRPHQDSNGTN